MMSRKTRTAALTASALLSAVVLLTGCNSPSAAPPASSSTATASASSSASSSPTASATPSSSPSVTSSVNALIAGFPQQLLPLMPGATLKSSSFDKTTTPATAAMVATTAAAPADILAFYTQAMTDQGFAAVPGDSVGTIVTKDFTRNNGQETVNVSVLVSGGTSTFTIGANAPAESLK